MSNRYYSLDIRDFTWYEQARILHISFADFLKQIQNRQFSKNQTSFEGFLGTDIIVVGIKQNKRFEYLGGYEYPKNEHEKIPLKTGIGWVLVCDDIKLFVETS